MQAARTILAQPAAFPEVVARLFDAEADPAAGATGRRDVMDMTVGDVQVQVRRTAPFTATEHARGAAMADLVSDVLERSRETAPRPARAAGSAAAPRPSTSSTSDSVSAVIDGAAVGLAVVAAGGRRSPTYGR